MCLPGQEAAFKGDRTDAFRCSSGRRDCSVLSLWLLSSFQPSESCLFLPRRSGTAHWVGFSLCRHRDSRDQERPVITTFLGLSLRQAGLCLKKQDTLGCCYFIGTYTHSGQCIYFVCVCVCTACTFTHTLYH